MCAYAHECTPPLVFGLVHKLHNEAEAVTFENLRIPRYNLLYVRNKVLWTYVYNKMSCMYAYISAGGDRVDSGHTIAIFIHCDIHYP